MKKAIKSISTSMIIAILLVMTIIPAFAVGAVVINDNDDAKVKVGDTLTYEMYLGDCEEAVEGLQAYIFYDKSYLEIDADSLTFPSLTKVVSNPNLENGITFNWTDVQNLADFSKKKGFVTVNFKVKKAGATDISYFISELYGEDMTYLKQFTFTYNIKVNDETIAKDAVPKVNEDSDNLNRYQGSFTNYADGKGEKNGSGKNHVAIKGEFTTDVPQNQAQGGDVAQDVSKGEDNTVMILTIIGVVAVIIAFVIVFILRNNYNKRNDSKN